MYQLWLTPWLLLILTITGSNTGEHIPNHKYHLKMMVTATTIVLYLKEPGGGEEFMYAPLELVLLYTVL